MTSSLFVATPLATPQIHVQWVAGALSMHSVFPGRYIIEQRIGSFLPSSRDWLTGKFLDSPASHLLFVDSDIGWHASDAQKLLDTGKDFVSGVYVTKSAEPKIPAELTDDREGELVRCGYVPGGFLLLSRTCVERMVGAYRQMRYLDSQGKTQWGLWAQLFGDGYPYSAEDVSFCRRWTAIGGKIWLHTGVCLGHYGDKCYLPA